MYIPGLVVLCNEAVIRTEYLLIVSLLGPPISPTLETEMFVSEMLMPGECNETSTTYVRLLKLPIEHSYITIHAFVNITHNSISSSVSHSILRNDCEVIFVAGTEVVG